MGPGVGTGFGATPLTPAPELNAVPHLDGEVNSQASELEMSGPVNTLRLSDPLPLPHKTFHWKSNFVHVNKPHLLEP